MELINQVLGEVGENYTMMKAFFPGRSVAQIKKKGLRENANPEKVTAAINARRPIGTFRLYCLCETC
jgi:transcription factor TFIIIB component B''